MRPPNYERLLRTYFHIAQQEHRCDHCITHPIQPGDEYQGKVWVRGSRLMVERRHAQCPYDPDTEAEWNPQLDKKPERKSEYALAA